MSAMPDKSGQHPRQQQTTEPIRSQYVANKEPRTISRKHGNPNIDTNHTSLHYMALGRLQEDAKYSHVNYGQLKNKTYGKCMREQGRERGSTTQNNNTRTQMHTTTLQSRLKDADPRNESTPFNTARLKWALSMRERQNSWLCLPVDGGA